MNPATLGTPCLVPVQVEVPGGEGCRGFITRLAPDTAAVSSDPALVVGSRVTLSFRSPAGDPVSVSGSVRELLGEGGLWRGRPAALVDLDEALGEDVLGPAASPRDNLRRRGSEMGGRPTPSLPTSAGLSGSLQAGLGRRQRTGKHPLPPKASPDPRIAQKVSDDWAVPDLSEDENTAPPRGPGGWPTDPQVAPVEPFLAVSGEETVPPVRTTEPELLAVGAEPEIGEPPTAETDSEDDEFFGMFGQVSDIPEHTLPQGAEDSAQLEAQPDAADDGRVQVDLKLAADGYFDPARSGTIDVPGGQPGFGTLAEIGPGEEESADPDEFDRLLETGSNRYGASPDGDSDAPPVRNTMSIGDANAAPPWEADGDHGPTASLIPRNARIASSLPVTFWARGRSRNAVAQNFSKEGLFMAYPDTPPVRGAIVRVEFPVEGDGQSVPVRFNAEVRWQSADRPGTDLPDGFGVQILTFESPKDRIRYDELLLLILSLHEEQTRREVETGKQKNWKWGTSGPNGRR